jgi:RimJ/RimL family protein N-acetyltransferase
MLMQTLRTERLLLRMFREEDFEEYALMVADAEVTRYLGEGKPLARGDAWRQIAFVLGHWQLRGYGLWAVEEASTGRLAGRIGFLYPEGWPDFELGWTLAREFWGRGYATEGARRALRYAFEELGREHVISLIRPDNAPSVRVAERLGESLEGRVELFGSDALVYGISRADWLAARRES